MTVLIVDGMSVFRTVAGAAAHLDRGFAYSFLIQVTAAAKKMKSTEIALCWEGGHARRAEILPSYKENRSSTPDVMREDRDSVKQLYKHLGCDQYFAPGHEADDVIACLANVYAGGQQEVVIMSADKDMLQLVRPNVSVYQKVRKAGTKTPREKITLKNFQEKTGWVSPSQYVEAHCALGDAVDCIPGIAGVGEAMIHAYHLGMDIPKAKRERLDEFYDNSDQYLLNKTLIDIRSTCDLPLVRTPGSFSFLDAYNLLLEMQFRSITVRFEDWIEPYEKVSKSQQKESENVVEGRTA